MMVNDGMKLIFRNDKIEKIFFHQMVLTFLWSYQKNWSLKNMHGLHEISEKIMSNSRDPNSRKGFVFTKMETWLILNI